MRQAFVENFALRNELGAACSIYYQGEKVVDLWGGLRNYRYRRTLGGRHDGIRRIHDQGHDRDGHRPGAFARLAGLRGARQYLLARVCPAGQGKGDCPSATSHQAGLLALDAHVDRSVVADLDRLAAALAAQKPVWEPGTRQAYHAITLGFYEVSCCAAVDPQHRSLGQFFQEEIASPLGLDFYIRLPEEIPNSRLATIQKGNPFAMLFPPNPFGRAFVNPRTLTHRAFWNNPGMAVPFEKDAYLRPQSRGAVSRRGGQRPRHC